MEPTRDEVDRLPELVMLEFGASWCPYCIEMMPVVAQLLEQNPHIRHIQVEDGRGKPLGRSFRVKLWPNFVLMRDGQVFRQMARPSAAQLRAAVEELVAG
jgi:thioredoxin 1